MQLDASRVGETLGRAVHHRSALVQAWDEALPWSSRHPALCLTTGG